MKLITEEQIKAITNTFYEINAPVKVYDGIQKLLNSLPDAKKPEKKTEKKSEPKENNKDKTGKKVGNKK